MSNSRSPRAVRSMTMGTSGMALHDSRAAEWALGPILRPGSMRACGDLLPFSAMTAAVRPFLLASLVLALVPASASAASVTITGDDGNPIPINATAPTAVRNMDVQANISVAASETAYYTTQVIGPDGVAASTASPCRQTRYGPTWTNYADYRGNG